VAVEDDAIRATALARDQTGDQTQVTAGEIGAWEHHDYGDVIGAVQRRYCGTMSRLCRRYGWPWCTTLVHKWCMKAQLLYQGWRVNQRKTELTAERMRRCRRT
jgi:hypothetical protein